MSPYIQIQPQTDKKGKNGLIGVTQDEVTKMYYSRIVVNGTKIDLGDYEFVQEACQAYDSMARTYWGSKAKTNY